MVEIFRPLMVVAGAVVLTGGLAACSSGDPAHDGLTAGIHGIASGSYEERVEDRETELEALRHYNEKLKGMLAEQEVDEVLLDQKLATAQAEYGQVETNFEKLRQSLADAVSQDAVDQERLAELDNEIYRLEEEFHSLSLRQNSFTAGDAARLPELDDEIRKLQRSLDQAYSDGGP